MTEIMNWIKAATVPMALLAIAAAIVALAVVGMITSSTGIVVIGLGTVGYLGYRYWRSLPDDDTL